MNFHAGGRQEHLKTLREQEKAAIDHIKEQNPGLSPLSIKALIKKVRQQFSTAKRETDSNLY